VTLSWVIIMVKLKAFITSIVDKLNTGLVEHILKIKARYNWCTNIQTKTIQT
jgi:hypothetical protein